MELWTKIVIGVLILALISTSTFGILQRKKVKEHEDTIASLKEQIVALQQEEEVPILRVVSNIRSGTVFDPTTVEVDTVPKRFDNDSYIKDPSILKGSIWRINLSEGTPITADMLRSEPIYPTDRYQLIMVDAVTPSTEVGDFVDLRLVTPSGIDFVVLPKKRVTNIYTSGVEFVVSEAEFMIYWGAVIDKFLHTGTMMYATKYVDPSLQNKLYATYVPPQTIVDYMNLNRNMLFPYMESDNIEAMRAYIETTQPWNRYKDAIFSTVIEEIRFVEARTSAGVGAQASSMRRARSEFIEFMRSRAEEEGKVYTGTNTQSSQVGAANVQAGQVAPGAQRSDTINPDGTYTDSNGIVRRPDGTPVIQSNDIVNSERENEEEQAEMEYNDEENEGVPNINEE